VGEGLALNFVDIIDLCSSRNILLAYEYDSPLEPRKNTAVFGNKKMLPKCPEVSDERIKFNGWKDEGHETFMLHKKMPELPAFRAGQGYFPSSARQRRKPYDLAVGLLLLSAQNHAPKAITVSSDGNWDHEWAGIRREYKKLFELEPECPFETETC
jgi:hypothetical protein